MSMRMHGARMAAAIGLATLWATTGSGQSPKLKSVEILDATAGVRIVLDVESSVQHRAFRLAKPDRVVIDLVGTTNGVRVASQDIATGPVARVRVSQFKSEPQPVTRVVADLREATTYEVMKQDEDLVLVLGGTAEADTPVARPEVSTPATTATPATGTEVLREPEYVPFGTTSVSDVEALQTSTVQESTGTTPASTEVASIAVAPSTGASEMPDEANVAATPVVESVQDLAPIATVAAAPVAEAAVEKTPRAGHETPGWGGTVAPSEDTSPEAPPGGVELVAANGRRINLDVQAADIHTVLRTLSDYSGKNIIASREVEGQVTARLYDIPWQDALGSILRAHGYGYVEENGILRVGVLQKIRNEELETAAAERKREDLLPIETRVVRMQFADADELKPALSDMLSSRGKIQVDARTNALIVSDIPDFVAKIAGMASDLDSRTPQVEIMSKLVDVSADDSRNLGINWEAINIQPGGSPVLGSAGVTAPTTGAAGVLRLGTVQSWGALDAMLDALQRSKRANVVSNPNITTVNNREAKILVGAKIPLIVADQAGNAITQLTTVGIQMRVTPHVNSDHTITMDLHPEVSELSSQATVQGGVIIQTSEADTRVLVENGETAIIGGLVRNVSSEVRTGVPVLQDVPLLGMLFRNTNNVSDKRELIIFVTPRIIEVGANRAPRQD